MSKYLEEEVEEEEEWSIPCCKYDTRSGGHPYSCSCQETHRHKETLGSKCSRPDIKSCYL